MITCVDAQHIIRPEKREIRRVDWTGQTIAELAPDWWESEFDGSLVYRNGVEVPKEAYDEYVGGNDFLMFTTRPGFSVTAAGGIAFASFALTSGAVAGSAFLTAVIVAAANIALSYGINLLLQSVVQPGRPTSDVESTTYGFANLQTNVRLEGAPIPVVYGEHRVAPPVINQYTRSFVDANGDPITETYLLFLLGEGPIQSIGGLTVDSDDVLPGAAVGGIETLQIENQPAENFRDVSVWTRLGSNDQTAIPGFSEPVLQFVVGQQLLASGTTNPPEDIEVDSTDYSANGGSGVFSSLSEPITRWASNVATYTAGDEADEFSVVVTMPRGLVNFDSNGQPIQNIIQFQIRYREVDSGGSPIGDYIVLPAEATLATRITSPFQVQYTHRFFDPDQGFSPGLPLFYTVLYGSTSRNRTMTYQMSTTNFPTRPANETEFSFNCWMRSLDGSGIGQFPGAGGGVEFFSWRDGVSQRGIRIQLQDAEFITPFGVATGEGDRGVFVEVGDGTTYRSKNVTEGVNQSAFLLFRSILGSFFTNQNQQPWKMVTVTYKAAANADGDARLRVYLDGALLSEGFLPDGDLLLDPSDQIQFFDNPDFTAAGGDEDFWPLHVSDTSIWSRELTAFEVGELHNGGSPQALDPDNAPSGSLDGILISIPFDNYTFDIPTGEAYTEVRGPFKVGDGDPDTVLANGLQLWNGPDVAEDSPDLSQFAPEGPGGLLPFGQVGVVRGADVGAFKRSRFQIEMVRLTQEYTIPAVGDADWTAVQLRAFDQQEYPGYALMAVRTRAQQAITTPTPLVTVICEGKLVPVWDGVSPLAPNLPLTYSANPAWVSIDMLTNSIYGLGEFYSELTTDLPAFKSLADTADELTYSGGERSNLRRTSTEVAGGQISDDAFIVSFATVPVNFPGIFTDGVGDLETELYMTFFAGGARNLAFATEGFTDSYWDDGGNTITANAATAPDGSVTADRINDTNALVTLSVEHKIVAGEVQRHRVTVRNYTFSVYVKADTSSNCSVFIYNTGGTIVLGVDVDLTAGTLSTSQDTGPGDHFSSISDVGNGWYRVAVTIQYESGQDLSYGVRPTAFAPTTTGAIFAWGAQVEPGSRATAYEPVTYSDPSSSTPSYVIDQMEGGAAQVRFVRYTDTTSPALYQYWLEASFSVTGAEPAFAPTDGEWRGEMHEVRYRYDGVFDRTNQSAWEGVLQVLGTARSVPIRVGSRVTVFSDEEREPVGLVNFASIIPGTWESGFSGLKDRPNAIEAEFFDRDLNYERSFFSEEHPTVNDPTKASNFRWRRIRLEGITRRGQIARHLLRDLNAFFLIRRWVSFEVGVDSLPFVAGDVIYVSHDVPAYGISGRCYANGSTTTFVVDRDVTLESGETYGVLVESAVGEVREERTISTVAGTYGRGSALTVSSAFSFSPAEHDKYVVGKIVTGVAKEFVIISIEFDPATLRRKITCIEYDEAVYDDVFSELPPVEPTLLPAPTATDLPPGVEGLAIQELTVTGPDGSAIIHAAISFTHHAATFHAVAGSRIYIGEQNQDTGFYGGRASAQLVATLDRLTTQHVITNYPFTRQVSYEIYVEPFTEATTSQYEGYASRAVFTPEGLVEPPDPPQGFGAVISGEASVFVWNDDSSTQSMAGARVVEARRGGWILGQPVFICPSQSESWRQPDDFVDLPANAVSLASPDVYARTRTGTGQYSSVSITPYQPNNPTADGDKLEKSHEDNSYADGSKLLLLVESAPPAPEPWLPLRERSAKLAPSGSNLQATWTSNVVKFEESDHVWVSVSWEAWQLHPITIAELDELIGNRTGSREAKRWTFEGPTWVKPGEDANCTIKCEIAWSTDDTPPNDWREYRPGRYFLRSYKVRLVVTRPNDDYGWRIGRVSHRATLIAPPLRDVGTEAVWDKLGV